MNYPFFSNGLQIYGLFFNHQIFLKIFCIFLTQFLLSFDKFLFFKHFTFEKFLQIFYKKFCTRDNVGTIT